MVVYHINCVVLMRIYDNKYFLCLNGYVESCESSLCV